MVGHAECKGDEDWVKHCMTVDFDGTEELSKEDLVG